MEKEELALEERRSIKILATKIICGLIITSMAVGFILFLVWGFSSILVSDRLKVAEIEYLPEHQEEIVINVTVEGKQSEVRYLRSYPQAWRIVAQAKVALTKIPEERIVYITDSSKLPQYQIGSKYVWQKDFCFDELPYKDTLETLPYL